MAVDIQGDVGIITKLMHGLVSAVDELAISVSSLNYDLDGTLGTYTGISWQAVTDAETNYVYLNSSGELVINTTGYPATTVAHIRLARVIAQGGSITSIYDDRPVVGRNTQSGGSPGSHASTHQDGGDDEISVAGLNGVLADAQNADKLQGRNVDNTVPNDGEHLVWNETGSAWKPTAAGGTGDVNGPASSTDEALARFDGAGGKTLQNSTVTLDDSGKLKALKTATYSAEYDNGNSGASKTIDWNNGQKQKLTLTDNCTLSFTDPPGAGNLQLKLIQDGTGSRDVTWPAATKFSGGTAPTLSDGATAEDLCWVYFDGTSYYVGMVPDFRTA